MITTLLESDTVEFEQMMERDYRMQQFVFRHPILYSLYWGTKWRMLWLIEHTFCKAFGHSIEYSGGYANPDSGGEGFECTRCERSWWHQYY